MEIEAESGGASLLIFELHFPIGSGLNHSPLGFRSTCPGSRVRPRPMLLLPGSGLVALASHCKLMDEAVLIQTHGQEQEYPQVAQETQAFGPEP